MYFQAATRYAGPDSIGGSKVFIKKAVLSDSL
jgi:hypothetical protein